MHRRDRITVLTIFLALAIIFTFTSCEKLKASRLKANHYFTQANHHFTEGNYRDAIEAYEQALSYNPDLIEAYRFLGESYKNMFRPGDNNPENQEKADKALDALNRALAIEPNNKDIIYSLGDMLDKLRNFEEAENLYLRIVELEPANMDNYYVLAEFYKRYSGEREELKVKAESTYYRRIEADPESPQGYAYLAQFYSDQINTSETPEVEFDKAYDLYIKITRLDPQNSVAWYSIGVNRFSKAFRLQTILPLDERKGLAEDSRKAILKAIEIDPNEPFPYVYMRMLYVNVYMKLYPERKGRYEEEAKMWGERYEEARKKQAERRRLEEELRRSER
ncbi:MAG: tetratricopeptide repeat protein [Candidatus Aminicenantes bacterium]|nr:MAG: tetratricopeptide repeat protein [Candidatus Aminicenantes bacterium]